jgi:hypothetical protein
MNSERKLQRIEREVFGISESALKPEAHFDLETLEDQKTAQAKLEREII